MSHRVQVDDYLQKWVSACGKFYTLDILGTHHVTIHMTDPVECPGCREILAREIRMREMQLGERVPAVPQ